MTTPRRRPSSYAAPSFSLDWVAVVKSPWVLIAVLLVSLILVSMLASCFVRQTLVEEDKTPVPGLPSYITREMVAQALLCQERYGHPAGATLAQIMLESQSDGGLSQLARDDHNLFGMKWASSFEGEPEVAGNSSWHTNEEVEGELVEIIDGFTVFNSDVECIEFRSRVFLQASHYAGNEKIKAAIADHDSDAMVEGLQEAGWATDSAYADKLKAIMDEYNLRRFDRMTVQEFLKEMTAYDEA